MTESNIIDEGASHLQEPLSKRQKYHDTPKKTLIINAFLMGSAGNQTINSWRNEDDKSSDLFEDPSYWTDLAKLLEKGKFNAVFFADVLGPYDVFKGPGNLEPVAIAGSQFPVSDPSYFIPLMASVTKNLAFGLTISTISEQPYHLARRLGTLDLITNGRVGWNIVTSYLQSASRNLLGADLPSNSERYERAEEFVDVVYKLFLSSWRDGAVLKNKRLGVFTDPKGLRHINHKGKHFTVPGPSFTQPSQQKLPVIIQAGASPKGKELAARNAEVIFFSHLTKEALKAAVEDVKTIAKTKFNRDVSKIKFLCLATVIIGKTHEEAWEKYEEKKKLADNDDAAAAMFSGWTGVDLSVYGEDDVLDSKEHHAIASNIKKFKDADPSVKKWTKRAIIDKIKVSGSGVIFVGTAEEVADAIEDWVTHSDIDGFNFTATSIPTSFEDIINELLPVLRKRGLIQQDYPTSPNGHLTFREQLFGSKFLDPTHTAYNLRWHENESKEEYESRIAESVK